MKDFFSGQQLTSVGRLSRRAYIIANLRMTGWGVLLFMIVGVLSFVAQMLDSNSLSIVGIVLSPIIGLYFSVVGIFLAIRRLHDLGMSGWLYLIMLIPIVNLFFGLYMLFAKGDDGDNIYGSDPKIVFLPDGTIAPVISDTGLIIGMIAIFLLIIFVPIALAIISFLSFQGYASAARDSKRMADLNSLRTKIMIDSMDSGSVPDAFEFGPNYTDPKRGEKNNEGCVLGYEYTPKKDVTGKNCGFTLSACMEEAPKLILEENSNCK